jgi:hypothetical protein
LGGFGRSFLLHRGNRFMAPTMKLDEFDRVIELDEGRCPGRTDEAFFPANIPGIQSLRRS